ncbi:FGGY-family carbohydrate kinase [Microbacterium sp.]|uniref:FGGY-family carbohydrate kinase n=1 Tax=Microbacterium sp. TaxID=51671 RepID=UPI00273762A4|nr:FGGY-family carbohydrate kinase [Microbacterium sp.]MDP3951487.1 FGGY-family carbohydrate kinase [Microbacterium sp.]
MNTPRYVVAIDGGSQSTKVLVVDEAGTIHASAQRRLRPTESPSPGHVVHPDDDLWDSMVEACREALGRFEGDPRHIVGAGLCTIRFCRALLDEDGGLVEPVLSWMDQRVSRPHEQDARVRYVTTSSGYLTRRLTGERRDSVGNQQGMWPVDQERWRWSDDPDAYVRTGMRAEQLLELVQPGELLGRVTAEAGAATGLPIGLAVYATANDKAVEALGSGLRDDDPAVLLSLGTYVAAMAVGHDANATDERYWTNFAAEPGRYLYESHGIRRGMWTVSWWRDLLDAGQGITDDDLNAGAGDIAPGSDGLFAVLDWLAPGVATHRRGALLGFDGRQGRFHVHRAILEGIALTMRGHVDAMEAALGRRFESVIVSGGGSRSDLMMRILAAVFERPVRRNRLTDAAGMGAAISAFVGAGVHSSWGESVAATVHGADRFEPEPEWVRAYGPVREAYSLLPRHLDALFLEWQAIAARASEER